MRIFIGLLTLTLVLAGCSRDSEDTADETIPSSEDLVAETETTADSTTTTRGQIGLEQATLEFTSCMRDQGIDTPDIRIDAQGRPVLDELMASVDTRSAEFRSALTQCADILTRSGALDLRSDPELQAVILDQLQEFSDCARREGLRDFPDPDPAFTGTGSPFPLDQVPLSDPGFQKAITACQEILGSLGAWAGDDTSLAGRLRAGRWPRRSNSLGGTPTRRSGPRTLRIGSNRSRCSCQDRSGPDRDPRR